jgi:membrane-bound acyltransferase YfiQ involved in biofilm formation
VVSVAAASVVVVLSVDGYLSLEMSGYSKARSANASALFCCALSRFRSARIRFISAARCSGDMLASTNLSALFIFIFFFPSVGVMVVFGDTADS